MAIVHTENGAYVEHPDPIEEAFREITDENERMVWRAYLTYLDDELHGGDPEDYTADGIRRQLRDGMGVMFTEDFFGEDYTEFHSLQVTYYAYPTPVSVAYVDEEEVGRCEYADLADMAECLENTTFQAEYEWCIGLGRYKGIKFD